MSVPARTRRICSYENTEVPQGNCYTLTDAGGEAYFCNARCLCIWAVVHVTHPRISEEQKRLAVELTCPDGTRRGFTTVVELAQWAAANALGSGSDEWLKRGSVLPSKV